MVLLQQIAPNIVPKGVHLEPNPERRAEMVCHYAKQIGCGNFVTPKDILSGNEKLNLAFTAYLFNKFPGLDILDDNTAQQKALEEAEILMKEKWDLEERERQLRWLQEEEERRRKWEAEEVARKYRQQQEEDDRKRQLENETLQWRAKLSAEEQRYVTHFFFNFFFFFWDGVVCLILEVDSEMTP